MSLARTNTALEFAAQFLEEGEGKAGLTVTVYVYRGATLLVSGESATELAYGVYRYVLTSSATGTPGVYYAVFVTAGDVDQKHLATMYLVGGWVDLIDASIDSRLAAAGYTAPDNAGIADIKAKTDNLPASPAAAGAAMTLTEGEREAVAVVVESHLLDEGDSQMLINAIVGAIGNANVDEVALVAAIRADLEREGGNLNTVLARLTSARAGYLDKLNVSGALAHTDNAATFRADVSGLATSAELATTKTVAGKLDTMLEADGPVFRYTANALEQAPAGGGGGGGNPWEATDLGDYPEGSAGWSLNYVYGTLAAAGSPEEPVIPIPAPPGSAPLCRLYIFTGRFTGAPRAGLKIYVELISPAKAPRALVLEKREMETGPDGYAELIVVRTDAMEPGGRRYRINCRELGIVNALEQVESEVFDLGTLIA